MSTGKAFEHLNAVAELTGNIAGALQNHIAARTAIRDYVICADETRHSEAIELIDLAVEFLEHSESLVEQGGPLDGLKPFVADLRKWQALAQEVHDKFATYHECIHSKVMAGFSQLAQSAGVILQVNASLATAIILDVQIANVGVMGYLLEGQESSIADAHRAMDSAKAKLDEIIKSATPSDPTLQTFADTLDVYLKSFHEAIDLRKSAYQVFSEEMSPLGNKIYLDLEEYQEKLIDIQEGIADLKHINDYRKKYQKDPPIH